MGSIDNIYLTFGQISQLVAQANQTGQNVPEALMQHADTGKLPSAQHMDFNQYDPAVEQVEAQLRELGEMGKLSVFEQVLEMTGDPMVAADMSEQALSDMSMTYPQQDEGELKRALAMGAARNAVGRGASPTDVAQSIPDVYGMALSGEDKKVLEETRDGNVDLMRFQGEGGMPIGGLNRQVIGEPSITDSLAIQQSNAAIADSRAREQQIEMDVGESSADIAAITGLNTPSVTNVAGTGIVNTTNPDAAISIDPVTGDPITGDEFLRTAPKSWFQRKEGESTIKEVEGSQDSRFPKEEVTTTGLTDEQNRLLFNAKSLYTLWTIASSSAYQPTRETIGVEGMATPIVRPEGLTDEAWQALKAESEKFYGEQIAGPGVTSTASQIGSRVDVNTLAQIQNVINANPNAFGNMSAQDVLNNWKSEVKSQYLDQVTTTGTTDTGKTTTTTQQVVTPTTPSSDATVSFTGMSIDPKSTQGMTFIGPDRQSGHYLYREGNNLYGVDTNQNWYSYGEGTTSTDAQGNSVFNILGRSWTKTGEGTQYESWNESTPGDITGMDMIDPRRWGGIYSPREQYGLMRAEEMGEDVYNPVMWDTRYQGYKPEIGRYMLSGEKQLPFYQWSPKSEEQDVLSDWRRATAISANIGLPPDQQMDVPFGSDADEFSEFARQLAISDYLTGDSAKTNMIRMTQAALGGGVGMGARAMERELGRMYDVYAAQQAATGQSTGGFINFVNSLMGGQNTGQT